MKYKILVISGTYDARELITDLKKLDLDIVATVTTSLGQNLLKDLNIEVIVGALEEAEFKEIINSKGINCILDASHPYASKVTSTVSKLCNTLNIPYIRYLRPNDEFRIDNEIIVNDYYEAIDILNNSTGNILTTTGVKNLDIFVAKLKAYKTRLFVRVLPSSESIAKCEKLGILMTNIIAMNGNFTVDMNKEILKFCNAKFLITKESGKVGGFEQKLLAAKELLVKTIVIKRPYDYEASLSTYEAVIKKVIELKRSFKNE